MRAARFTKYAAFADLGAFATLLFSSLRSPSVYANVVKYKDFLFRVDFGVS